jgi:hypothetical protein
VFLDREMAGDYRYDEDEQRVEADIELECNLEIARVYAIAVDGGLLTYTVIAPEAPPERRLAVAEFLTRTNHGLPNGNFEFDMDTGIINYKTYTLCADATPSDAAIRAAFGVPVTVINFYGDELLKVIQN